MLVASRNTRIKWGLRRMQFVLQLTVNQRAKER